MVRVLLVIKNYFDAMHVASLIDWEANGYELIMELNAISGLRRINDIKPDILLLHHDAGWLDVNEYISYIRDMYLPTKLIIVLGKRGVDAASKGILDVNENVPIISWEDMSAGQLLTTLKSVEDIEIEKYLSDIDKGQEPSEHLYEAESVSGSLLTGMESKNLCLIRAVLDNGISDISVRKRIEGVISNLPIKYNSYSWIRDIDGSICFLFDTQDASSTFERVERINATIRFLSDSIKNSLDKNVKLSVCYKLEERELDKQISGLKKLEKYRYFCREVEFLSENILKQRKKSADKAEVSDLLWKASINLAFENLSGFEKILNMIFMDIIKPSMNTQLLSAVRKILLMMCKSLEVIDHFPEPMKGSYEERKFDYAESEMDWYLSCFSELYEKREALYKKRHELVNATIRIFLRKYYEPLSIEVVAEELGVTSSYLGKVFRANMGSTPIDSLREIRMLNAQYLMMSGATNIADISSGVGFRDSKYFSRVFKDYFGVSPSEMIREMTSHMQG